MKKKDQLPVYYPMFLNITGKSCVVVGGGEVALRKVKILLEHGAKVEVISPELCPELEKLARTDTVKVLQREYRARDLNGAFIAIAATDNDEVNRKVVQEARERTVLLNVVDKPEDCDFIVPSYLRRGDVTIAVSTGGRSPALARKLRTELEKDFGEEYAALALLIDEARTEIKAQGIKVDSDTWQEALDLDLLAGLVRRGDKEKAKAVLLNRLKNKTTVKVGDSHAS
ncbi:MAG: bifunctional precorrin-2 dehydrogenase/sirohydrochlorin ferrochelatase [Chloroflexi bacterium]|nr:bifunctional precorrin-2 dehydrogenase/sirohydrochlorin ferrochelatase [Chloroflexota bacterium]